MEPMGDVLRGENLAAPGCRILVFAPSFEPAVRAGGPARTLSNLVRELEADTVVDVVTPDRDLGGCGPFSGLSGRKVTRGTTTVYYLDLSSPTQVRSLLARLSKNRYHLIMLNSIWNYRLALIPALATSASVLHGPVLLMPHGELEPGALALKSGKKRLARLVFRAVYRRSVAVFGATSESEASNIAGWFPATPVVTTNHNAPDTIPWGEPAASGTSLRALHISRIHPTKGLLPLLAALGQGTREIRLSVVGPVEDPTYWQQCQQAISQLPAHVTVHHTGLAQRDEIPELLWNADCMVLLTAGENYGHVIAEALQAGCPVITTPTTPWTNVLREGGGDIIENREDPAEVTAVLNRWARKTPAELAGARRGARQAFEKYSAETGPNIIDCAMKALGPDGNKTDARVHKGG